MAGYTHAENNADAMLLAEMLRTIYLCPQPVVAKVHGAGATIIAWTVNEIGDLERMARLGVDGLCGNYPDRIRVAIAARIEEGSRV